MKRVVIGMSGGVDSSVAAAYLKEQGYEVIGLTMKLWEGDASCSSPSKDAENVAKKLGIEFHILDFQKEFSQFVIDYFINEYINGRTPNPCIACNKFLKFDAMAKAANHLGADYLATGHYAKIKFDEKTGRYLLLKADADSKDQTYVLYNLSQDILSKLLLPLGDFTDKSAVREYAEKHNLLVANKPDSQEICFIPDNDYVSFIKERIGYIPKEGDFVDLDGNILGRHKGIVNYTIGQRKGLGIAFGKPMFVNRIDAENNHIVLGEQGTEFSDTLYAINENFIAFEAINQPIKAFAKVRYSAKPAACTIYPEDSRLKVVFDTPQRAITPGQAVVFYDGDIVLGGATIIQAGV